MKKKAKTAKPASIKGATTGAQLATAPIKKRQRFTPAERAKILSAAKSRSMTAKQVQTAFGVTPVTYYLWRRKAGVTGAGRGAATVKGNRREASSLPAGTREAVRRRVRSRIDELVRDEVEAYLVEILGASKSRN